MNGKIVTMVVLAGAVAGGIALVPPDSKTPPAVLPIDPETTFAHVNANNIVDSVIVADQTFIDSGAVGDPASWLQASEGTHGDKNDTGVPYRKNFPAVGYTYDKTIDGFVPDKPPTSTQLDTAKGIWIDTPKPAFATSTGTKIQ